MKRVFRGLIILLTVTVFSQLPVSVVSAGEPDWSKMDAEYIDLFYPGQTSWEWLISSSHKGQRQTEKGLERCIDCHQGEEEGRGEGSIKKLDDSPPPKGTPPMITLLYKAAYDDEYLYLWLNWPGGGADEGRISGINIMVDEINKRRNKSKVKYFKPHGCWLACHKDEKSMPFTPPAEKVAAIPFYKSAGSDEVTMYLPGTRTRIDSTGGWANLEGMDSLRNSMKWGEFIDLWRFISDSSTPSGRVSDEYVLAARFTDKGQDELSISSSEHKDGEWTVVLRRKLNAGDRMEDKIIKVGKRYVFAIAIHDNNVSRRHYAAFSRVVGFDDPDADINIQKVK